MPERSAFQVSKNPSPPKGTGKNSAARRVAARADRQRAVLGSDGGLRRAIRLSHGIVIGTKRLRRLAYQIQRRDLATAARAMAERPIAPMGDPVGSYKVGEDGWKDKRAQRY